ncbi:DNA helicase [Bacteroidia bacterium]|nr:DNA helicase [Bacteroidia bacterium]
MEKSKSPVVVEPDYLIDISSLAECFKPYGAHPLNFPLSRLQTRKNTAAILLGNAANFFMDELVNEDAQHPVELLPTLKKWFRSAAFELTACEELKNPKLEKEFFANCKKHFEHIRYAVQNFFPQTGIDKNEVVLEPSFICNTLGLQGRLDVLLCDYSRFIELKSGKAVEDFRNGGVFVASAENHYIQMLLYWAVLEANLDLPANAIASYLLYSKYPVLSKERHLPGKLQEALTLRNQIVEQEYLLQKNNNIAFTQDFLDGIRSEKMNVKQLSGNYFDMYLAPEMDRFNQHFEKLNVTEQAYFLRLYNFVVKELWLSKVGEREYEGVKKSAVLWNAPLEEKLQAGEILYDLTLTDNQAATETHTVTLSIPETSDLYLPNFRAGDAIVLYERNMAEDTVNNRQVFKGAIENLDGKSLKIRLRYRQNNPQVWNENSLYAIEHDYMDTTYTGMFRALNTFVEANEDRRELLTTAQNKDVARHVSTQNDEVFLLIGPPGTGKTSISLKQMVADELSCTDVACHVSNILLLSYTNRAVDEICKAVQSLNVEFIRIGSELNCAPEFRAYLLENRLKVCDTRKKTAEVIKNCRIFVGTVASVWNKPELFQLKSFDLAIVDEATQLLEPHLLGVFCAKNSSGKNAVKRFVLIGDHKQLPAVVLQSKEESKVTEPILNEIGLTDLSASLFERLYRVYQANGWVKNYAQLSKQGRMHPEIAAFPSNQFYNGLLESAGLPHQMEPWNNRRLQFYNVLPDARDISTKTNRREAEKVVEIVQNIQQTHPQQIGIITPFRNQIALIRKLLQEVNPQFSEITIDTVERFQGSQRDAIIYSFCIQTENQLAALPNWLEENGTRIDRKLNVVLTRAKKQLHVIGNEELLAKNLLYQQLIEFLKQP